MADKIKTTEVLKRNVSYIKSSKKHESADTTKIGIPRSWFEDMGVTREDTTVRVYRNDRGKTKRIVIEKMEDSGEGEK